MAVEVVVVVPCEAESSSSLILSPLDSGIGVKVNVFFAPREPESAERADELLGRRDEGPARRDGIRRIARGRFLTLLG